MNDKLYRSYYEDGCLCVVVGYLPKLSSSVSDQETIEYYETNCRCSRHPDGTNRENHDAALERFLRKLWRSGVRFQHGA